MDQSRFDAISRVFGDRSLSRRQALARGAAALTGGAIANVAGSSRAQDTPPEPTSSERRKHPLMMFIQTFQRGRIARTTDHEERYTVTLEQGVGETIYFSDRPDRFVGTTPTDQFLDGLGFLDDNPPNAALILETSPGESDIAVVELFNPIYDAASSGVTYDVEVLAHWRQTLELEFTEVPTGLEGIAPTFGAAQLFIDDCPNYDIYCYYGNPGNRDFRGSMGPQDHCFSWEAIECVPCSPDASLPYHEVMAYWDEQCNAVLVECQGNCRAATR